MDMCFTRFASKFYSIFVCFQTFEGFVQTCRSRGKEVLNFTPSCLHLLYYTSTICNLSLYTLTQTINPKDNGGVIFSDIGKLFQSTVITVIVIV